MLFRTLAILVCVFISPLIAYAETRTNYTVDRSVFERHPELAADYVRWQEGFELGVLNREQHRMRLGALEKLLSREPDWVDGYWLSSAESFVLASSYDKPKDYPKALPILEDGIQLGERCLQKDKSQVLCKFFLASLMAKKASLEGIFSSLRLGYRIHRLWMDVLDSPYDFWFRPNVSLQGSVRYGLGIFYRLVPNRWLLETMFRIRGNLDKSVAMHREALTINPDDPCARLMLGTALLCRCRGDQKHSDCSEGVSYLESVFQGRAFDSNQRLCQNDVNRILKDRELACGYTQALQVTEEQEKAVF